MDTSMFTFAHDVVDEGAGPLLDNVLGRAGADAVLMAVTYHDGRDLFPHGRSGRVRYLEPGSTYFRPDAAAYATSPIKPRTSSLAMDRDPLRELVEEAGRRGADVHAWTVFLHHDRIGEHLPYTPRNAFGDAIQTDLCASNPGAQAWAHALTRDLASRGVRSIVAEALQFFPLEHGVHHERYFLPLGPRTRFLLGLCFCTSCEAAAGAAGVDGAALREWARGEIQAAFDGDVVDPPGDLRREDIGSLAGGDLGAYLAVREGVINGLAAELRAIAAEAGVRLTYLDPSGAIKGYATGKPVGGPSPTVAWSIGLDLAGLARACDDLMILGYAADPAWIAGDIAAYRSIIGPDAGMVVAMRPAAPDTSTVDNLRAKVELAEQAGVKRVDFYHYGLVRLDALDRIRGALRGETAA